MKDEKKATKKPASKATDRPKTGAKNPASKATNKPKTGAKNPASKATDKPKKETFPHFRKYKKSGHPALILNEYTENEYNFRKVMHAEEDGGRKNEMIDPNPDKDDPIPMGIATRVRHDKKKYFSTWIYPWKYRKGTIGDKKK